jgi:hypothetical protein
MPPLASTPGLPCAPTSPSSSPTLPNAPCCSPAAPAGLDALRFLLAISVEAQPAAQQRHRARHDPQQQQQQAAAASLDISQFDWGKHYLGAQAAPGPLPPLGDPPWLLSGRALAGGGWLAWVLAALPVERLS